MFISLKSSTQHQYVERKMFFGLPTGVNLVACLLNNYDDNIRINCHSIGRDRVFGRVPFNNYPTPLTADSCTSYEFN